MYRPKVDGDSVRVYFAVFLLVVALHYALVPAESIGSAQLVQWGRVLSSFVAASIVLSFGGVSNQANGLWVLFCVVVAWFIVLNFGANPSLLFLISMFVGAACMLAAAALNPAGKTLLSRALDALVYCWLFALIFQVLGYFAGYGVLDLHGMLHPYSAARIQGQGYFLRFTGVHIEPGTYANWMYGLLLLRLLVSGRIFDGLAIAAMLSILVTMSAWGLLTVLSYFLVMFFQIFRRNPVVARGKLTLIFVVVAVVAGLSILENYTFFLDTFDYFYNRAQLLDASGTAKVDAYGAFSIIFLDLIFSGLPLNVDFCNGCDSPQDAGIFVNLVVRGGLIFAVVMFGLIARSLVRIQGLFGLVLLLPLAFGKYFYFDPIFWFLVAFAAVSGSRSGVVSSKYAEE